MEVTLNTGAKMPMVGLGTWKAEPGVVGKAVEYALTEGGYRHIDGAWIYRNEPEVGEAYANVFGSGKVKREDVFITSKLWNSFHKAERVLPAVKETLSNLKLDYLDLYLMHWGLATPPAAEGEGDEDENGHLIHEKISIRETWEAMQELVKSGLVKAIGVSNFTAPMILDILSYAAIPPAVNQIELHPYLQQARLVEFCQYKGIAVTAYSPLGSPANSARKGIAAAVADPAIAAIAKAHGKTPAQILVRFAIERGTVVIPKSTHPERIKENIDVFDFKLGAEGMSTIAGLERHQRGVDPYTWGKVPYFD